MAIRVAVGVVLNNAQEPSQVLIALRPKGKHKGGFWEFPGGKIESAETAFEALTRELKEEVDIHPITAEPMTEILWQYSEKQVLLDVMIVREFEGEALGREGQEIRWVEISALKDYKFPEANKSIVDRLLASI